MEMEISVVLLEMAKKDTWQGQVCGIWTDGSSGRAWEWMELRGGARHALFTWV